MRYYCFGKQVFACVVASGGKDGVPQWLIKGISIGHLSRGPHQGFEGFPYKMLRHFFRKKTPIFGKIKTTLKKF